MLLVFIYSGLQWLLSEGSELKKNLIQQRLCSALFSAASQAEWGNLVFSIGQGITEIKTVSMNKEEWTLQDVIVHPWSQNKFFCNAWREGVRMMGLDTSVVPSNRTRSKNHKLEHRKFQANMRKNCFILRVTGNKLSREASKRTWMLSCAL